MADRQEIALAEHAEAYITEQQRADHDGTARQKRSKRGTKRQREFYDQYGVD